MGWIYQDFKTVPTATGWTAICHTLNGQMTRSNGLVFDHEPTEDEVTAALAPITTQWDADDAAELAAAEALKQEQTV